MATVESIITDACDLLNRPDVANSMRRRVATELAKLHGTSDFGRDIVTGAPSVPTASPHSIALPTGFRKLAAIEALSTDGAALGIEWKPRGVERHSTYFGYVGLDYTFMLAGGACTLELPQLPASVALKYYGLPTTTTAEDGTVSSDSWIVELYPDVLLYRLLEVYATVVEHKGWLARAAASFRDAWIGMASAEQQTPEGVR